MDRQIRLIYLQLKEKQNQLALAAPKQAWGREGMDIYVTILEFKNYLKAIGYADTTIDSYNNNLNYFKQYLSQHKVSSLKEITSQRILDYQSKIMNESVAMETKALKIRAVKRLFEHLTESHKLLINPTEGIVETCRKNRKIGIVLTIEEIKELLNQPDLSLNIHMRNRAIMEVMYSSGIRLDELLNLNVYDADIKDRVIFIRKGKGKKQRVVPAGKQAVKYLKEYLNKIRPHYVRKNSKERKLFLNRSGYMLSAGSIRAFLRKYRISAGIKKSVSPHTLRRTCATHFLQQGADIRYVQKLLGHKDLRTTQSYTKIMPVEVKKTHDKTHPGINDERKMKKGKKDED